MHFTCVLLSTLGLVGHIFTIFVITCTVYCPIPKLSILIKPPPPFDTNFGKYITVGGKFSADLPLTNCTGRIFSFTIALFRAFGETSKLCLYFTDSCISLTPLLSVNCYRLSLQWHQPFRVVLCLRY